MDLKSRRQGPFSKAPFISFISIFFFFSIFALLSSTNPCLVAVLRLQSPKQINCYSQGIYRASLRRYLSGPGSSPPRCTSKCGSCNPCKPVHVPVPPGTPVTAEYYPEAWRCKCGNKLYMP